MQLHGGAHLFGGDVLDLSVNVNPLGMPEGVRQAVIQSACEWEKYPDPDCVRLRERLSAAEGVPAENIVCGNGAADLIYRIVHAFKPKTALICAPTFGEYAKALGEVGCQVKEHMLLESEDFALTERFLDELTSSLDIVFICSPNNPTGRLIDRKLLLTISEKCTKNGTILVCDECFIGFCEKGAESSLKRCLTERCIVLNAFTKLYCMAGLRLGYAVFGSVELARQTAAAGQFWSVSTPAQAAGIAALDEGDYLTATLSHITRERNFLEEGLTAAGCKVYPSDTNFLLFRADPDLFRRALESGILLRSCQSFSALDNTFYRTAVRMRQDSERLIQCGSRNKGIRNYEL